MELTLPNKKECIGETEFMFNPLIITTMVNQNVAFAELSMDEMTTVEGGLVLEAGLILLLLIAGTQKAF